VPADKKEKDNDNNKFGGEDFVGREKEDEFMGGGGEDKFVDKEGEEIIVEGEEIVVKEEDVAAAAAAVPAPAPPMPLQMGRCPSSSDCLDCRPARWPHARLLLAVSRPIVVQNPSAA
jgi:hypothetical protein